MCHYTKYYEEDLFGQPIWTMTSSNVEEQLKTHTQPLARASSTPMAQSFILELDSSPELNSDDLTFNQEMIGVFGKVFEIERVDILTELSLLSPYQASTRQGHLVEVYHIFTYLKCKPKLKYISIQNNLRLIPYVC